MTRVLGVRRAVVTALIGSFLAGPAMATDGRDAVAAMSGICITSLESGAEVGPGLSRADTAMEAKLLNGKTGKIWRTWNSRVVIVAHASGDTCEVMGINIAPSDFANALVSWRNENGSGFAINAEANMTDDGSGGAYLATLMPEGDFIQMFVQTQPEVRFVGVTVSRVQDSVQARELLGL